MVKSKGCNKKLKCLDMNSIQSFLNTLYFYRRSLSRNPCFRLSELACEDDICIRTAPPILHAFVHLIDR